MYSLSLAVVPPAGVPTRFETVCSTARQTTRSVGNSRRKTPTRSTRYTGTIKRWGNGSVGMLCAGLGAVACFAPLGSFFAARWADFIGLFWATVCFLSFSRFGLGLSAAS
jgi:hypothetical protein